MLWRFILIAQSSSHWTSPGLHHQSMLWRFNCLKPVHHASIWLNIIIMAQCCASDQSSLWHYILLLNAVLASIYGLMLCIRHHNMAQTCVSYIGQKRASMTQAVHHAIIAYYSTTHHTKLTTSCFVHFRFCYFICS